MENKECLSQLEMSPAIKLGDYAFVDDTLLGKYYESDHV